MKGIISININKIIEKQIKNNTEEQYSGSIDKIPWYSGSKKPPEELNRIDKIKYVLGLNNNYSERISLLGNELSFQIDDTKGYEHILELFSNFFNDEIIKAINSNEIKIIFYSVNEQNFWYNKDIKVDTTLYREYRQKVKNTKIQIIKLLENLKINVEKVHLAYFDV